MDDVVKNGKNGSILTASLEFTLEKLIQLADANSVLGERIEIDGMTVIPVSKVSVGFAGGGADVSDATKKKKQNPAGTGGKVTLTPMTFLVIKDGRAEILNITPPPPEKPKNSMNFDLGGIADKLIGKLGKKKKNDTPSAAEAAE